MFSKFSPGFGGKSPSLVFTANLQDPAFQVQLFQQTSNSEESSTVNDPFGSKSCGTSPAALLAGAVGAVGAGVTVPCRCRLKVL